MASKRVTLSVTNNSVQMLNLDAMDFTPGSLFMTVIGSDVRVSYTDERPTPEEGHIVFNGGSFSLSRTSQIKNFSVISRTPTTAQVTISLEAS